MVSITARTTLGHSQDFVDPVLTKHFAIFDSDFEPPFFLDIKYILTFAPVIWTSWLHTDFLSDHLYLKTN